MKKDFRVFTIRRMFIDDVEKIENCYQAFDFLHFNPLKKDFIEDVLIQGSFWAVYDDEKTAAITYILPADCPAFSRLNAAWEIEDLLNISLADCFICGYLWVDDEYNDIDMYSPLCRLWTIQASKQDKRLLVHYTPAHIKVNMESLFHNGFDLVGLRGLDNLVPHYIFTKDAQLKTEKTEIYMDIKSCPSDDTKTISMLCEHGYRAFDLDWQKNLLFRR